MCSFLTRPRLAEPICYTNQQLFSSSDSELKSRIYLDNTLKIRKPEIGRFFGGKEGERLSTAPRKRFR